VPLARLYKPQQHINSSLQILSKQKSEPTHQMGDTTILAPSVQELAKQGIQKVPEQYLQPNQDPVLVSNISSLTQLPIINLDKLLFEDDNELEKLDQACKEWGFFQVWINYLRLFFNISK
jgi:hypothetical protein